MEKEAKDAVRKAKKKFEKNLAKDAKKNPKAFYTYLKSKTSNRQSVGPLQDEKGSTISDDEKQAEMLNHFFSSVFTKEDLEDLPHLEPFSGTSTLNTTNFSEELVKEKINKLRSSAAPGPDGICPRLLQSVVDIISNPLATIYTKFWRSQ